MMADMGYGLLMIFLPLLYLKRHDRRRANGASSS